MCIEALPLYTAAMAMAPGGFSSVERKILSDWRFFSRAIRRKLRKIYGNV